MDIADSHAGVAPTDPTPAARAPEKPWCRVLIVEHDVRLWGGQFFVLRVAPALELQGVELILAAPPNSGLGREWSAAGRKLVTLDTPQDRYLRTPNGRISLYRLVREPVRVLRGAWRTARLARAIGADIIEANSHGWSFYEVAIAGWITRRPTAVHLHMHLEPGAINLLWGFGVFLARRAISDSNAIVGSLPRWARSRVDVVYNGIDTERFRPGEADPAVRQSMTDDPSAPVVVVMARLIPEKGIDDVIKAVASLPPELSHTRLAIAGSPYDESYGKYLRDLGASLLGNRVRFLGTRTDVDEVVRAADVLALASDMEGLPFCVMEAQASGKPVVSYPSRGVAELIDHEVDGLLAAQGDIADLAKQLARVLADQSLAARLGNAARARVLLRHTLDRQGESHAAVFRRLMGRRRWQG